MAVSPRGAAEIAASGNSVRPAPASPLPDSSGLKEGGLSASIEQAFVHSPDGQAASGSQIAVTSLSKTYRVHEREAGAGASSAGAGSAARSAWPKRAA